MYQMLSCVFKDFKEFHSNVFGLIVTFMIDIRGNRITGEGIQHSDNPLVYDYQWESLENFFLTSLLPTPSSRGNQQELCHDKHRHRARVVSHRPAGVGLNQHVQDKELGVR